MKKLTTLILLLTICFFSSNAQSLLYKQTFDSSYADWSLNTTDLGGDNSLSDNQWTVNNTYLGGLCIIITIANTANEPSGISGYPQSNYLHIFSAVCSILNCNYDAAGALTYFARMNNPLNTTGDTGVTLSFWWLCNGSAAATSGAAGKVYYSIDSGTTWTQITTPRSNFNLSSAWAKDSVHLPAFDGQRHLQFGFQFKEAATGNDPAFAVDDIKVTGTHVSGTLPVASFTTSSSTICQDSCITLTSTSTGTIDSIRWYIPGITVSPRTSSPATACFTNSGTYTAHLYAYNSSGVDSSSTTINVTPTPHPSVTQTGHTLSVSGAYTSYQWSLGGTPISGATSSSYTYTVTGTYQVTVDSAGCIGKSTATLYTLGIQQLNNAPSSYSIAQSGNNTLLNTSPAIENDLDVNVYDATGRIVLHHLWRQGTTEMTLNTMDIRQGLYIIKISGNGTSWVMKWMKP